MAREPPLCRVSGFVLAGYEEVLRGRALNRIGCERDVKFVPKPACGWRDSADSGPSSNVLDAFLDSAPRPQPLQKGGGAFSKL